MKLCQKSEEKEDVSFHGGAIDEEKTARILLDEFKNGKLGKITVECPKENRKK